MSEDINKFKMQLSVYETMEKHNMLPSATTDQWLRIIVLLLIFIAKMVFWLVNDKNVDNNYSQEIQNEK